MNTSSGRYLLSGKARHSISTRQFLKHVVVSVLMSTGCFIVSPSVAVDDTFDEIMANHELSLFVHVLRVSGLLEIVRTSDHMSLFVPTDSDLQAEGSSFLLEQVLIAPENKDRLDILLKHHIVLNEPIEINQLPMKSTFMTLAKHCLELAHVNSTVKVGPEATITNVIPVLNGTVFVINRLLWLPFNEEIPCRTHQD